MSWLFCECRATRPLPILIVFVNIYKKQEGDIMPLDDKPQKPQQNEFSRAMSFFLQISVTIIACLAVGIFLGYILDRYLGTSPWLLMVCTFMGVGAAFKSIFDFAKKIK